MYDFIQQMQSLTEKSVVFSRFKSNLEILRVKLVAPKKDHYVLAQHEMKIKELQ